MKTNQQEDYEKEKSSRESIEIKENSRSSDQKQENSRSSTDIKENSRSSLEPSKQVPTIPSLNIRINNLQFRSTSQSSGEFIKWFPNQYYNKLLEYLDNGWEDHGDLITKGHVSMGKSLFASPESCITIGYLEANKDSNCCNLSSVGPRILELSLSERNDFFEVYTLAETKLLTLSNEPENQN